jgi:hypothetical protein
LALCGAAIVKVTAKTTQTVKLLNIDIGPLGNKKHYATGRNTNINIDYNFQKSTRRFIPKRYNQAYHGDNAIPRDANDNFFPAVDCGIVKSSWLREGHIFNMASVYATLIQC